MENHLTRQCQLVKIQANLHAEVMKGLIKRLRDNIDLFAVSPHEYAIQKSHYGVSLVEL